MDSIPTRRKEILNILISSLWPESMQSAGTTTQHTMLPEFREKWGTLLGFPLPTLLREGYVTLKNIKITFHNIINKSPF